MCRGSGKGIWIGCGMMGFLGGRDRLIEFR